MSPEKVAKIAIAGMFKDEAEIIPGYSNKLNAFLPKFFPKKFVENIAGKIYEPKQSQVMASASNKVPSIFF